MEKTSLADLEACPRLEAERVGEKKKDLPIGLGE